MLVRARISTKYPTSVPRSRLKTVSLAGDVEAATDEGSRISCARCDVPLTGREQFLGHMAISHETTAAEAELQWARLTHSIVSRIWVGEKSS